MSYATATSSTNNLSTTTHLVAAYPFAIGIWFYFVSGTPSFETVLSLGKGSGGGNDATFFLMLGSDSKLYANLRSNTTETGAAISTTTFSAGVWNHALGVYTSSTSRAVYLNGGSKGTNTTSIDPGPASINMMMAAAKLHANGTPDANTGALRVAGACLYSMTIGDTDAASLGAGESPLKIQRANLLRAPDFLAQNWDPMQSDTWTINSATFNASNPNLRMPRRRVGGLILPDSNSMRLAA